MKRVLAVSPHLDDAIFSAGGTLAAHVSAGDRVIIATCFTANVAQPSGFALACQLDKGLPAETDYMALRRTEDRDACAIIGAQAVHLPFLEAPHRGYECADALFAAPLVSDRVAADLIIALSSLVDNFGPDLIYGPWGIGGHVDHLVVRRALEQVGPSAPILWWEDYPYAMKAPAPPPAIERQQIEAEPAARKLAATLAYQSQLGFQFGGVDGARQALANWRTEGFAA